MKPDRFSKLEIVTAVHVGLLVVFSAWAFGGGTEWARTAISISGSLSLFITAAAIRDRLVHSNSLRVLHGLWPLLGFNVLVFLSLRTPLLRTVVIEGGSVYVPRFDIAPLWPATARADLAWRDLWLFDAIYLSCFNLVLAVQHRRVLRGLLVALAINALALAIFGTVQKLAGSQGLYFGQVASPNPTFFASFIYHNHWGAFVVLMLALCLGLVFHEGQWAKHRDFWHSPAPAALTAAFLLALTVPLSGSRSCTALALLLIAIGLVRGLLRIRKNHRATNRSAVFPTLALLSCIAIGSVTVYDLARQSIEKRAADTREQLASMRAEGSIGARAQLYGDTWRMARDRLWFGWGLGSYGTVFSFYNTLQSSDNLPQFYENAHSDWLQTLAETGIVGALLMALLVIQPLFSLRRVRALSGIPHHLLTGCALLLLYATIEFPFGNAAVTLAFWCCLFCAVRWAQIDGRDRAG